MDVTYIIEAMGDREPGGYEIEHFVVCVNKGDWKRK